MEATPKMPIRGKKIAARKPVPRPRVRGVQRLPPPPTGVAPATVVESPIVADKTVPSEVVGPAAEVKPITRIGRTSALKEMGVITH